MNTRALSILLVLLVVGGGAAIVPTAALDGISGATGMSSNASSADDLAISVDETGGEQTVIVRLVEPPPRATQASTPAEHRSQLQSHAASTQRPFERFAAGNPHVELERSLWITNALVVTVDTDRIPIENLGFVDNVEAIHEDFDVEIDTASATTTDSRATAITPSGTNSLQPSLATTETTGVTWGLQTIRTPETSEEFENRGQGVRIAVLDTGVDPDHPDIDVAGWKDFNDANSSEPVDYGSHGTHVSGTVVGGNDSGTTIGVAPEAELYHAAVLTDCDGTTCSGSFSDVLDGIQWAVDNDADVITMSLGADGYLSAFIDPLENARTAGTIPVTSSGNSGPNSSSSPGNIYDAFAVGATNDSDSVVSFSSGETIATDDVWGDDALAHWPSQYTVPDLSAPGEDVYSAVPNGGYDSKSGTSMAAPHVSGAIALMLSNGDGEPTPEAIEHLLTAEAVDIDDPDFRQGAGRLDVYNATLAHSRSTLEPTITSPEQPNVSESTTLSVAANHPIEAYYWQFGNETTQKTTASTINHSFSELGTTTVSLTLADERGNITTVERPIDVVLPSSVSVTAPESNGLVANETVSIEYDLSKTDVGGVAGVEYRITDDSTGEAITNWTAGSFTNSSESVTNSVVTDSLADGSYTVAVRLVDADGEPFDTAAATDNRRFDVKATAPTANLSVESAGEFELFGPNNPATFAVSVDDPLKTTTQLSITNATDSTVTDWELSNETGTGEQTTVDWNATDAGRPLDSGTYTVRLTAVDEIGNTAERTKPISVDTDSPTVSLQRVTNASTNEGDRYFVNGSNRLAFDLNATDGREVAGPIDSLDLAIESRSTNHRHSVSDLRERETAWNATFDTSRLGVDGEYALRLTAVDRAGNVNQTTLTERLNYAPAGPETGGTIVDSNGTNADVVVRSDKPLRDDPTATVTTPDNSTHAVELTAAGDHWNGSFETDVDGIYELAVSGTDRHGNTDSDSSSVRVDTASSTDNELVIYNERTETFVHIETDREIENQFVVVSESTRSPAALRANQSPVGFLTSTLADELAGNITNATIGIPTATYEPPAGLAAGDERLGISYYNEETETWEDRETRLETVEAGTFGDEIEGEYWLTTVESFSSYGLTATNNEPPEIVARSPEAGEQLDAETESVTLEIEYEDDLSAVNASAIEFRVDGQNLTGDDNTDITSKKLTHTGFDLEADTSYAVELYIEDTAANGQWYDYEFSVDAEASSDDSGADDDSGDGGSSDGLGDVDSGGEGGDESGDDGGEDDESRDEDTGADDSEENGSDAEIEDDGSDVDDSGDDRNDTDTGDDGSDDTGADSPGSDDQASDDSETVDDVPGFGITAGVVGILSLLLFGRQWIRPRNQ